MFQGPYHIYLPSVRDMETAEGTLSLKDMAKTHPTVPPSAVQNEQCLLVRALSRQLEQYTGKCRSTVSCTAMLAVLSYSPSRNASEHTAPEINREDTPKSC